MKSFRFKHKETGKYFRVKYHPMRNTIRSVELTRHERRATIFQPEAHIIPMPNGNLEIGKIRCSVFNLFLHEWGLTPQHVLAEEFELEEQPLFPRGIINEID